MDHRDEDEVGQSSFTERLRQRIKREGHITFYEWMKAALYDPQEGYYCRSAHTRWGRAGDYRTSPELSPLFAATFARYFASLYIELGTPDDWTICEAGAGAGHFAGGVLETLQSDYPAAYKALHYLIDEVSDDARRQAQEQLAHFGERVQYQPLFEDEAPLEAAIVFSNEFLDAFPVHRVQVYGGHLQEMCVAVNSAGEFIWTLQEPASPELAAYLERGDIRLAEGQIAEINLAAVEWLKRAAAKLKRGYLVTVDYGAEASELYGLPHRFAGTLRAFSHHQQIDDVLAHAGEQDLTTTVDWTALKRAGEENGLQTISLQRQDQFLLHAGLLDQLERLTARAKNETEALILRSSVREMILPGGMGTSFQVLVQRKT